MEKITATYKRPIKGSLVVELENGEKWYATPEDLKNFGYVERLGAHMALVMTLEQALPAKTDIVNTSLNCIRYASERAIFMDDPLSEENEDDARIIEEIRRLVQVTDW